MTAHTQPGGRPGLVLRPTCSTQTRSNSVILATCSGVEMKWTHDAQKWRPAIDVLHTADHFVAMCASAW